jgi:hypothetical protein
LDIFSCYDRWGQTIVLTDRAWAHILEDHGEMVGRLWAIEVTVRLPDYLMEDAQVPGRVAYYRANVLPEPVADAFVKVVVAMLPPDETGVIVGEVVTAYATPARKRGERQRWP